MLCNNLVDKINYVNLRQKEHPETKAEKLMQEYCETKCDLEYCKKYELDYISLHEKFAKQSTNLK